MKLINNTSVKVQVLPPLPNTLKRGAGTVDRAQAACYEIQVLHLKLSIATAGPIKLCNKGSEDAGSIPAAPAKLLHEGASSSGRTF